MIDKKCLRCSFLLIVYAVAAVAFAGESDPNLCYTEWAGQCQTQRQWEAGWCYANVDYATCAALYPDITMQSSGQNANSGSPSSMSANGSAGQSAGGQADSGSLQQQSGAKTKKSPVEPSPTKRPCRAGYDCPTDPPKKLPATPTPPPGQSPPSNPSCPPGHACAS